MSRRRWLDLLILGVRLARLRLFRKEANRRVARQAIADQLMNLGGIAMKVGQVAADTGAASELRPLLDGAPARPMSEMRLVVEQELEQSLEDVFAEFDESRHAASLGQVHRAWLHDGQEVAVKVQYPGIRQAVDAELALGRWLPSAGPVRRWDVNLDAYRETLAANMLEELDYRSEARRQQTFAEQLQVEGLVVPKVHEELVRSRVLVQQWQHGDSLEAAMEWSPMERMLIGRTLLLTLFQSLFRLGQVHGDPHQGNYRYRRSQDGRPLVILYDYGCTIPVSETVRMSLLKLLVLGRNGRYDQSLACFQGMGFDVAKLAHIASELPLLSQILFRPLLRDEPLDPEAWEIRKPIEALLGERKWWFRSAGPSDLFLLMRVFQGLLRQLRDLKAHLPWWPILCQAVGPEVLRRAEAFELPEPPPELELESNRQPATRLRILIQRDGRAIQDLTLPAQAALELEQIMPDQVRRGLAKAGHDGDAMKRRLLESGFDAQTLFEYRKGDQDHRIWLE